ncbi:MAG: hypothetical protein OHK0022_22280 [Roseiflexaceae bacterium]
MAGTRRAGGQPVVVRVDMDEHSEQEGGTMDFSQVESLVREAIQQVLVNDRYLIVKDLNERSISHWLAVYLSERFRGFNVDCEYNGNADRRNRKPKYIQMLKNVARELGILSDSELISDDEHVRRKLYPDIVIHRRDGNGPENNLLIIEMKKSTSQEDDRWDQEKLRRMTSSDYGNTFPYCFGAFVRFRTGRNPGCDNIIWFQNGMEITGEQHRDSFRVE